MSYEADFPFSNNFAIQPVPNFPFLMKHALPPRKNLTVDTTPRFERLLSSSCMITWETGEFQIHNRLAKRHFSKNPAAAAGAFIPAFGCALATLDIPMTRIGTVRS